MLKDEPRDLSKVEDRKIRLFTLGPMTSMITTKMYYGMFMGIFTANALNVETVGGLNCFSPDWGTVYKNLSKHPHIINGDFKKFDKKTSTFMMMCAFTCIIDTKIHYDSSLSNENMLNILVTLASEVANPLIMLDKDLLEIPGSLSSGVLLTFLINNIVNSLYIRLAWISCYVKHNNSSPEEAILCFDDHVVFYAMGDDNVYSVSDYAVEFFNFATIQAFFKSIGLDYTNSDKTDKVYKSLPLSSATICKRKWIFDEEYDVWKCPLEKTSIMKMLTIGIKSSALTLDEQQEQCVISALIEFAQWGRQEYYARVEDLRDLVRQDFIFDDYEVIMERQKNYGLTPWVPWEPEEIKERFFSC